MYEPGCYVNNIVFQESEIYNFPQEVFEKALDDEEIETQENEDEELEEEEEEEDVGFYFIFISLLALV